MHENEPARPTTTSKIICKILPNTQTFIWSRTEPPQGLIDQIQSPEIDTCILFPSDRPELKARVHAAVQESSKEKLIIVPDGTWKEVRKIIRKSPWLDNLPLLSLAKPPKSIYDLRRNPDADHLCTAETIAMVLKSHQEDKASEALMSGLMHFIAHYKRYKQSH